MPPQPIPCSVAACQFIPTRHRHVHQILPDPHIRHHLRDPTGKILVVSGPGPGRRGGDAGAGAAHAFDEGLHDQLRDGLQRRQALRVQGVARGVPFGDLDRAFAVDEAAVWLHEEDEVAGGSEGYVSNGNVPVVWDEAGWGPGGAGEGVEVGD